MTLLWLTGLEQPEPDLIGIGAVSNELLELDSNEVDAVMKESEPDSDANPGGCLGEFGTLLWVWIVGLRSPRCGPGVLSFWVELDPGSVLRFEGEYAGTYPSRVRGCGGSSRFLSAVGLKTESKGVVAVGGRSSKVVLSVNKWTLLFMFSGAESNE